MIVIGLFGAILVTRAIPLFSKRDIETLRANREPEFLRFLFDLGLVGVLVWGGWVIPAVIVAARGYFTHQFNYKLSR